MYIISNTKYIYKQFIYSFQGESFSGTHRVEPRIQRQEGTSEDFPGGPPLWGDSDEEESHAEAFYQARE